MPDPGLAPMTMAMAMATLPGAARAFVTAWTPTASGSTMAPAAKETGSGSLKVNASG